MKRILTSSAVFASVCALGLALAWHARANDDRDESVVGTWILTATLNGPPGAPPFAERELVAFNPGGTLTLTSSAFNAHSSENPFLPPFLMVDISDGYGSWQQPDGPQFSLTFKRHLFAGSQTPQNLYGSFFLGQFVGEATIQAVGTLRHDGDEDILGGSFTFQARDLLGAVVGAGSGTFSATRLKIESLATP